MLNERNGFFRFYFLSFADRFFFSIRIRKLQKKKSHTTGMKFVTVRLLEN